MYSVLDNNCSNWTTNAVTAVGAGDDVVVRAAHRRLRRSWCFWCTCGARVVWCEAERERERILRPQKFVRMRVRVDVCVHVTCAVLARGLTWVGRLSEQPSLRWPKQGAAGDQARWRGERSGLCKVHRPTRRPMEGAMLFRPIMWLYSASGVLRFVPFQPAPYFDHLPTRCTLFWPLPKNKSRPCSRDYHRRTSTTTATAQEDHAARLRLAGRGERKSYKVG